MAPPTDVATGWTEPRALKNKARVWVTDPLIAKTRDGAKVPRRHDTPTTPYQRLPDCGTLTKTQAAKADRPLPQTQAAKLTALYRSLNPAQLRRDIAGCQRQLRDLSNQRTRTA